MLIQVVNLEKIVALTNHLSAEESLEKRVKTLYIPSLWGKELVDRDSFRGKWIHFVREWIFLKNEDERWGKIFRAVFKDKHLGSWSNSLKKLPEEIKAKLYHLKYLHVQKPSVDLQNALANFDSLEKLLSKNLVTSRAKKHWVKDADRLSQASFLRGGASASIDQTNSSIVKAIFELGTPEKLYGNPTFANQLVAYFTAKLEAEQLPIDELKQLWNQAQEVEGKLQKAISKGKKGEGKRKEALQEVKVLAQEAVQKIGQLIPREKCLFFGGTALRPPQVKFSKFQSNPLFERFQKIFNGNEGYDQIYKLAEEGVEYLRGLGQSELVTQEMQDKFHVFLTKGLVGLIWPGILESLLDEEQSVCTQGMLSPIEFLRESIEKKLVSDEKKLFKWLLDPFSAFLSQDICLAFIESFRKGLSNDQAKEKLEAIIDAQLEKVRKTVLYALTDVTSQLPEIATASISALGYGDFGQPEEPIWFEVIRQNDLNYALHVYASGVGAVTQHAVPLVYEGLSATVFESSSSSSSQEDSAEEVVNQSLAQLNHHFFESLFAFRVYPEWEPTSERSLQYTLNNIHENLLASLETEPKAFPEEKLRDVSLMAQEKGPCGLFKAHVSIHCDLQDAEQRNQLFFKWKCEALVDFWKCLERNPLKPDGEECLVAEEAAMKLIKEALELHANKKLDDETLKGIYATTWEILETLEKERIKITPTPKPKGQIVPTEMAQHAKLLFGKSSKAGAKIIKGILLGFLGEEAEVFIDEMAKDFLSPQESVEKKEREPPKNRVLLLGKKVIDLVSSSFIGLTIDDLVNPGYFTPIKTVLAIVRLSVLIATPPVAFSVGLGILVAKVVRIAANQFGKMFFPDHMKRLKELKQDFYAWQAKLLAEAVAYFVLDDDQKKALFYTVKKWKTWLTHTGELSLTLPPFQANQKTFEIKQMVPSFEVEKVQEAVKTTFKAASKKEEVLEEISSENCRKHLKLWVNKHYADEDFDDLHRKIKSLPCPSRETDMWDQIKNPKRCLELIHTLNFNFYTSLINYISDKNWNYLPNEYSSQLTVTLFKLYAIIDKLARRLPETLLEGFETVPWPFILFKNSPFFSLIDPRDCQTVDELYCYFAIDPSKKWSEEEIEARQEHSLFLEIKENYTGLLINKNYYMSMAARNYYEKLLTQADVIQKLQFDGFLESDPVIQKLVHIIQDPKVGCLKEGKEEEAEKLFGKDRYFLPRSFHYLRLANLCMNKWMMVLCNGGIYEKTVWVKADSFSMELEDQDNTVRKWGAELTDWEMFKGENVKKFQRLPFTYARFGAEGSLKAKKWLVNPPYRLNQLSMKFWSEGKKFAKNRNYKPVRSELGFGDEEGVFFQKDVMDLLDGSSLLAVINNQLARKARSQEKILKKPSTYKILYSTEKRSSILSSFAKAWTEQFEDSVESRNFLCDLKPRQRAVVEMIWQFPEERAVRTLSFFSEIFLKVDFFPWKEFESVMLFRLLLLHEDVLEHQLKMHPEFAIDLGQFFDRILNHFILTKVYNSLILNFMEIGIYALVKARSFYPKAAEAFPDFTKALFRIASINEANQAALTKIGSSITRELHGIADLLALEHLFVDPKKAQLEEKTKAAVDCGLALQFVKDESEKKHIFNLVLKRWLGTFKELLENPKTRDPILTEIAKRKGIVPEDFKSILRWVDRDYGSYESGLYSLLVDFVKENTGGLYSEDFFDALEKEVKKIFGIIASENLCQKGNNFYVGATSEITVEPLIQNTEDETSAVHLIFRKTHKNRQYVLVSLDESEDTPQSHWLEEACESSLCRAIVMRGLEVVEERLFQKTSQEDDTFVDLGEAKAYVPLKGYEVNLEKEEHQLHVLAWFQPLSKISAYRSLKAPHELETIEFRDLDLTFKVQEIDGKKRAVSPQIPGYYIAHEQAHPQIAILQNHAQYLLLENRQHQYKVILTSEGLLGAIGSWAFQKATKVNSSLQMDLQFILWSSSNLPKELQEQHQYYVYDIDLQGRFMSDNPAAILHLLLYSIASGQQKDLIFYLNYLEELGRRSSYSLVVKTLLQKLHFVALASDDPLLVRISLRLAASFEDNRLIQGHEAVEKNEENLLSLIVLQMNYSRDMQRKESLSYLPFEEEDELMFLQSLIHRGEKLFGQLFNQGNKQIRAILEKLNVSSFVETCFLIPQISKRYVFLAHKHSYEGERATLGVKDFCQSIIQDQLIAKDSKSTEDNEVGYERNYLQKLLYLFSPASKGSLEGLHWESHSLCFDEDSVPLRPQETYFWSSSVYRLLTTDPTSLTDGMLEIREKVIEDIKSLDNPEMEEVYSKELRLLLLVQRHADLFPSFDDLCESRKNKQEKEQRYERLKGAVPPSRKLLFEEEAKKASKDFVEQLLKIHQAEWKAMARELQTDWKTVSENPEHMKGSYLFCHFMTYYQLAKNTPPKELSKEDLEIFHQKAARFKQVLYHTVGISFDDQTLLQVLRLSSCEGTGDSFPDPNTYLELLESTHDTPNEQVYKLNKYLRGLEKTRTRLMLLSLTPWEEFKKKWKAIVAGVTGTSAASMLLKMTPLPWVISGGLLAYKSAKTAIFLAEKYQEIQEQYQRAKIEKSRYDKENYRDNQVFLSEKEGDLLKAGEKAFEGLARQLVERHLKFPKGRKASSIQPGEVEPLVGFTHDSFEVRGFARLNKSCQDFAKRAPEKVYRQKFKSFESYFELQTELRKAKESLDKDLEAFKMIITKSDESPIDLDHADPQAMAIVLGERSFRKNPADTENRFRHILQAFIQGDDKTLAQYACADQNQLQQLKFLLLRYLVKARRSQQLGRALGLLKQINPANRKDPETRILIKKLGFELSREGIYDITTTPRRLLTICLAFEYGMNVMLWEGQFQSLKQSLLSEEKRIVTQRRTGDGKTLTMIIGSMFGVDGKQGVYKVFPAALAPENIVDSSERAFRVFGQKSYAFEMDRDTPLKRENLWALLRMFSRSVHKGFLVHGKHGKRDLQALELRFILAADAALDVPLNPEKEKELFYFMKILDLIANKIWADIDEPHLIFRRDELNYPLGETRSIDNDEVNVITACVRFLVALPEVKKSLKLQKNEQSFFSSEDYKTKIKPILAQNLLQYPPFSIPQEHAKEVIAYLCGHLSDTPEYVLKHPRRNEINLAACIINDVFEDALKRKVHVKFGLKALSEEEETQGASKREARPYVSKDSPYGGTFKLHHEALVKTFMSYLFEDLSEDQVMVLALAMISRAEDQSRTYGIPFEDTASAKLFMRWVKGHLKWQDLYNPEEKDPSKKLRLNLKEIQKYFNQGFAAKLSYVREAVVENIKYYVENCNHNSHNFGAMFPSIKSGTASPNNDQSFPTGTKVLWAKGTAGETVNYVRTYCADHLHTIAASEPQEILEEILKTLFLNDTDMQALIDSGALFFGLTNEECADFMLACIHFSNRSDLKAVAYYDAQDRLMIKEYGKTPSPLRESTISPGERLTYYDHAHSLGADIKQAIQAKAVVTISEDLEMGDFAQGIGRMRGGAQEGQVIHFAFLQRTEELIRRRAINKYAFMIAQELIRMAIQMHCFNRQWQNNVEFQRQSILGEAQKIIQNSDELEKIQHCMRDQEAREGLSKLSFELIKRHLHPVLQKELIETIAKDVMKNQTLMNLLEEQQKAISIDDLLSFLEGNENAAHGAEVSTSIQQQVVAAARSTVLDYMRSAENVTTMLSYFKTFRSFFISRMESDISALYGFPRMKRPSSEVYQQLKEDQYQLISNHRAFQEKPAMLKQLRLLLDKIGEGYAVPAIEEVPAAGALQIGSTGLGISQEVTQSRDVSRKQNVDKKSQVQRQQRQNLQMNTQVMRSESAFGPRKLPAKWPDISFSSIDWFKSVVKKREGRSEHSTVELYKVRTSLAASRNPHFAKVAKAFQGRLYWSSNLRGILENNGLEKLFGFFQKPIFELLVIEVVEQNKTKIITCAIDQREVMLWRNLLAKDNVKDPLLTDEEPFPLQIRVGLFDINLNAIVATGKRALTTGELRNNPLFNFDIARWRFLAGRVSLPFQPDPKKAEQTEENMKKWIQSMQKEDSGSLKAAFKEIYKVQGTETFKDSEIESLLGMNEQKLFPDLTA